MQVFGLDGALRRVLGGTDTDLGQFMAPYGVAIVASRLIISESTAGRLQVCRVARRQRGCDREGDRGK